MGTSIKRSELQNAKLQITIDKLDTQAKEAIKGNREDLAQSAIRNKADLQSNITAVENQISETNDKLQKLKAAESKLTLMADDFRNNKVMLQERFGTLDTFLQGSSVPGYKKDQMMKERDKLKEEVTKMQREFAENRALILNDLLKLGALNDETIGT